MFVCLHPTLGLQVGPVGREFFFILMKVSFVPRALPLFDISLVAEKKNPLSETIVIINSDIVLINHAMRGYDLTSVPQTLEALQNTFIVIYRCEICPYYACILFTWKSKCPRGCCFFTWQYFLISYYFHRFSCNRVAVNLDPTVLLLWNGSIAEKSFVYFFRQNLFLQISKRSSVQVLKILTV